MSDQAEIEVVANATRLLVDVKEVATMLATSTRTVWRWSAVGEIPAPVKIGGAVRWHRQDLLDFVARAKQKAARERKLPAVATVGGV